MSLIAGRYQLLGAPGAGAPQRARDLQTAQTVLLRDVLLPDEGAEAALARAQAAQGIFHPSLLTLFDVVLLASNRVLLAYEFVPSQSIAQMSGGRPFNAKRAVEIVAEIADAVAEIHARGLAHGGISQQTVLVTLKGKAKLDRLGDPSLTVRGDSTAASDVRAAAELLNELVGKPTAMGHAGSRAIDAVVERGCSGRFESAAVLAAMLRQLGN